MTWNVLKWVAIAAMFIDHTAAVMGGLFPFSWYDPMRDVGRMAFPIFAYGIAQGCVYTHSARRYLGRLLLFAVLSELPYRLALRAGSLAFGLFNVFFTLLAGAACCQLVKFCRSKGRRWAWAAVAPVAAIVLLCEILGTDYGGFGVLCILLPYLFWESKPARIIALGSVVAFLYIVVNNFSGFSSPLWWVGNPAQFWYMAQQAVFALAGVGLVALYNGQPGSKRGKWVFYVFYPAHLLALWLLRAAADLTIFYLEGDFHEKKRDDRRKKRLLLPACAAVLLGACLLLRVGGAAWKNSQLEAGFTPSPRFSDYRDGVPMEEMDVSQYQVALSVITNPVYGVYYFTCSQDISYYAAPGGEPVYTIPAGTELAWSYGDFLMDTYPTYWKGWRWGTVFPLSGEETPQGYFFVPISALEGLVRDFYNATPSVEEERIQRGLSRKEVRDGLLLRVDEIFYRRGVCVSPDLRAPLWGWDCTLLAGGCALAAGAWAAVLRRRKMRKEN